MITQVLHCPNCQGTDIVKHGKSPEEKQRYKCRETACDGRTFILDYAYPGQSRLVKKQILDMALNGSGVRDTARVLHISPSTVIRELKKRTTTTTSELAALKQLNPGQVQVGIYLVQPPEEPNELESELDEMWSYVGKKDNPRWLWHAIEHQSGKVLAYVFGRRKDEAFVQLKKLLEPFGISHFYTDGWGAYERHIEAQKHEIGKQNMQKIESKHINLRTRIKRLARKTICFSKTVVMHDIVIGLFINRSEFGMAI